MHTQLLVPVMIVFSVMLGTDPKQREEVKSAWLERMNQLYGPKLKESKVSGLYRPKLKESRVSQWTVRPQA